MITNEMLKSELKGLRAKNNMSLEDVAKALKVHRETVRKYENNPGEMDVKTLFQLLKIYNIEPLYFFNLLCGNMPYKERV